MLISVKAGAKIQCTCDKCKREFFFGIPLMEFEHLEDFKQNVIDTMNAEGWKVDPNEFILTVAKEGSTLCNAGVWHCAECAQ